MRRRGFGANTISDISLLVLNMKLGNLLGDGDSIFSQTTKKLTEPSDTTKDLTHPMAYSYEERRAWQSKCQILTGSKTDE